MSKKETENKNTEKVMTRYDQKMQRRAEEKAKEKREKLISTIVSVVIVLALAALVISIPVSKHMTLNGTYITVADKKITKVEYDFHYYQVRASYLAQYGSMLSAYMGIDIESDFDNEMYSDTMTWRDMFDEMTVGSITRTKALAIEAEKAGFTYDTTQEYADLMADIEEAAAAEGLSVNGYLQECYGPLATVKRVENLIKSNMVTTAYYNEVMESKAPTTEDLEAYYTENKDSYDVVDYRITTIEAELPTEPTELADPVEETAEDAEETEETTYEPSEAEIAKAMEDAKVLADAALAKVKTEGTASTGVKKATMTTMIGDWLFDASRKTGDTTVLEDTNAKKYYVLAFEKRYRDETPSADVRVVMLEDTDPQPIYDEWKNGAATEESFAELCDKYSADTTTDGGFYEQITKTGMQDVLSDWLFDEKRAKGDTEIIKLTDAYTYIVYYVGPNKPEWEININNILTGEAMEEYLEEISKDYTVEDPKGNLDYIEIREKEAADAAEAESESATTEE